MKKRNANIIIVFIIFCIPFLSFSQNDDGMTLLEDSDDVLIKFENHYFEALKYKAIGNYTRAIVELEKCQQLFPDDVSVDFEFAKNYFELNKLLEAELYIEKALVASPKNYWYLELAKEIYLKQFNYQKAIEVQQKIIEEDKTASEDLVLIYIKANEREKAQLLIDELQAEGITSSKLRGYEQSIANYKKPRSENLVAKETESESLEDLKKAFKNNKQFSILKEILTRDFQNENFQYLLLYSTEGLELFPGQPFVYLMNGRSLFSQKKYNEAIDVLVSGIDFIIEDSNLELVFYKELVLCYELKGDTIKAKEYKQKMSSLQK